MVFEPPPSEPQPVEPVPALHDPRGADLLGRGPEAGDHLGDGAVADDVEAGLDARLGAREHVRADLLAATRGPTVLLTSHRNLPVQEAHDVPRNDNLQIRAARPRVGVS